MTLDQAITHAAARAAVAMSNGEEQQVAEWTAEVTRLLDQRDRHCPTFDELAGSPDHSRLPSC